MSAHARHAWRVAGWAAMARAAGSRCVLGNIESVKAAADALCIAAVREGCSCLRAPAPSERLRVRAEAALKPTKTATTDRENGDAARRGAGPWSTFRPRAFAARARFAFARQVLKSSGAEAGLLMHDADLVFRPGGLTTLNDFTNDLPPVIDFAASDNGSPRRESYDDLSWGIVWMRGGSKRALNVLDCLLGEWDHPSFQLTRSRGARSLEYNPGGYFTRSQPRVNHLIESSIEGATGDLAPRVCLLPRRTKDAVVRLNETAPMGEW